MPGLGFTVKNILQEKARYFEALSSPLGELYVIFHGNALTGMSFEKPNLKTGKTPASFKKQLAEYFAGSRKEFNQPVVFLEGTDFEHSVWTALKEIPYGETRTYKWLADRVGRPAASRAVGQALSKNPVPIVLPCHRVIESDGNIGGYSSGVETKRRLLALEYYHSK